MFEWVAIFVGIEETEIGSVKTSELICNADDNGL